MRTTSPPRSTANDDPRVATLADVEASPAYTVLLTRSAPLAALARELRIDYWARDLLPSRRLLQWFINHPGNQEDFEREYRRELSVAGSRIVEIVARAGDADLVVVVDDSNADRASAHVLLELFDRVAARRRSVRRRRYPLPTPLATSVGVVRGQLDDVPSYGENARKMYAANSTR